MRSRNVSVVSGLMAVPSTAKLSDSRPSQARLYKAGTSRRLVRSPEAPKMSMMQGPLGGPVLWNSISGLPSICAESVMKAFLPDCGAGCFTVTHNTLIATWCRPYYKWFDSEYGEIIVLVTANYIVRTSLSVDSTGFCVCRDGH